MILAFAITVSGCAKLTDSSDENLADRQAAEYQLRLLEHFSVVPDFERNNFVDLCLEAAGFKPTACGRKGVISENLSLIHI